MVVVIEVVGMARLINVLYCKHHNIEVKNKSYHGQYAVICRCCKYPLEDNQIKILKKEDTRKFVKEMEEILG